MIIHKRARLTPVQRQEIFNKYYNKNIRICDLCRQYSISRPIIYRILERGRHKDFSVHKSVNKRFRCLEYGLKRLSRVEAAFKIAASMALQEAVKRAKPVLLEPIMQVEVITPEQFLGSVVGDLNSKRAQIEELGEREGLNLKVIKAKVPLSEMFGYITTLRSMTEGRAMYTMEFNCYEIVPQNIAELIKEGKK